MDKKALDILYSKGYLTTYVDAEKYENVDDLFAKGIITIPGAREEIYKLLAISIEDKPTVISDDATVVEEIVDEPADVDFTPENITEEIETVVETSTIEEVIDETSVVEEIVDEPITETKKKISTKKPE